MIKKFLHILIILMLFQTPSTGIETEKPAVGEESALTSKPKKQLSIQIEDDRYEPKTHDPCKRCLTATMSSVGGLILSAIEVAWMPEDLGCPPWAKALTIIVVLVIGPCVGGAVGYGAHMYCCDKDN